MSGERRVARWAGGGAAVVLLGSAAVAVSLAVLNRPQAETPPERIDTATAAVARGTVSERLQLAGVLGYDGSYPVAHQAAPGIVTWTADLGSTVDRGGPLYAVANRPVRLLIGALPAYRDFAEGMADGPDVKQLEENLAALGMRPGRVDSTFTADTGAAVRRWQAASGLPAAQRTGALPLGTVVFAPVPLRISQLSAAGGTPVGPGAPVLNATSGTKVVTAQLTTDRAQKVHAGEAVQVSLSSAAPVTGTVLRVGRVAVSAQQSQNGPPRDDQGSGTATVTMTVGVTLPAPAADLDQAPVQVSITTLSHPNVLLVPVTALLARPGGGYQVRLESGDFVRVDPGLFDSASGMVEVTGSLTAGQKVQVPAS
jgi:peptidoglycan hydrolase-like protein with peptidoglycan-binding domain